MTVSSASNYRLSLAARLLLVSTSTRAEKLPEQAKRAVVASARLPLVRLINARDFDDAVYCENVAERWLAKGKKAILTKAATRASWSGMGQGFEH
ncbi:hypothetical protein NYV49_10360 [Escherichia coli]|nr:hypothetical protein [Escherichia coli]